MKQNLIHSYKKIVHKRSFKHSLIFPHEINISPKLTDEKFYKTFQHLIFFFPFLTARQ
jgi:hypothetical protein